MHRAIGFNVKHIGFHHSMEDPSPTTTPPFPPCPAAKLTQDVRTPGSYYTNWKQKVYKVQWLETYRTWSYFSVCWQKKYVRVCSSVQYNNESAIPNVRSSSYFVSRITSQFPTTQCSSQTTLSKDVDEQAKNVSIHHSFLLSIIPFLLLASFCYSFLLFDMPFYCFLLCFLFTSTFLTRYWYVYDFKDILH